MPSDEPFVQPGTAPRPAGRKSRWRFRLFLVALILTGLALLGWRAYQSNVAAGAAIEELTRLSNDQELIDAIIAQNAQTHALSKADIDALDRQYARDKKTGIGLAADLMMRPASLLLKDYAAEAQDRIVFIMLMDDRGLNVADSRLTTDYFQGDEEKWSKTFLLGPGAVHWGGLEKDYVTGRLQHVVARTVTNPKTGDAIGAVAIAYDQTALKRR